MNFSPSKDIDVTSVGHALMDILVEVEDSFVEKHNLAKGGMKLVDVSQSEVQLAELVDTHIKTVPGGASANTARGVSALGGRSAFFGTVGEDMYGEMYDTALSLAGVQTFLHKESVLTGNAITYITPDHQRTFSVHLGAASHMRLEAIDEAVISKSKVIHLEAFQLEGPTKEIIETVIKMARNNQTLVSLDLNDAGLIERNLDLFKKIVREDVDILFVNETEGAAFTGTTEPLEVIEKLKGIANIMVLKCGADGAHIIYEEGVTTIAAEPANVVDTTGAGDLFAAGFLYGLTHRYTHEDAGALGSKTAAKIISQIGVDTSVLEKIS